MTRIPVSGPWITEKEIAYVTDAVTNAWYENHASYHERFERGFERYLGVRHAVSLPSCTSALHLALAALGIGPGDEVVVPDVTWIATSAPIRYVGAEVVFADIDRSSWCLAADAFEAVITSRTRAVIVVDLYGNMPDMAAIREIATRRGIAIIEDAAEAHGSEQQGRKAGAFGDVGVFSFHGSKTMTTGEGGMLVTDRTDLFERVSCLRDHGRAPGDRHFFNREIAFKYKMSSMQAALGLAQLERIDELITRKRQIFEWYRAGLAGLELQLNSESEGTKNTYWMVTALMPRLGATKERWMELLSERGIDSRPFFHPLSSIPAYAGTPQAIAAAARNVVSYELGPWGINLPSGLNLDEVTVMRVCEAVREIAAQLA
ncbi:MAG: DegT/DnrJ/EryC1/StrS aminotransferase family protein [Deltaproteobacteria bacterium]|nr:DegT/DnrJ/EryC1/StrS aminotransferase family protein [Deltaproteobacteria bacterium]